MILFLICLYYIECISLHCTCFNDFLSKAKLYKFVVFIDIVYMAIGNTSLMSE